MYLPPLVTLLVACSPPEGPDGSPLVRLDTVEMEAQLEEYEYLVDLLEIDLLDDRTAIGAGEGGVIVYQITGSDLTYLRHYMPAIDGWKVSRFHHVEPLGGDIVAATNRNRGIAFLDVAAEGDDGLLSFSPLSGVSGMATTDGLLYVVSHDTTLYTWDVSDPRSPTLLNEQYGLESAWEIAIDGAWAYIADSLLGVIPVDLSDPAAPALRDPVESTGSPQDLVIAGGVLYVAAGSAGIEVYDLTDPAAPRLVEAVDHGDAVVSVSVSGDLLWVTDYEDVRVYDLTDPLHPAPLASDPTEEWALHVAAFGDRALVADWGNLHLYELDREVTAPDARVDREALYFYQGSETLEIELLNRGGADLEIADLSLEDPRFAASAGASRLAPGTSTTISVTFEDDGQPASAALCLATNDPDRPLLELTAATRSDDGSSIAVGERAIDFVLPDVDGDYHQLSDRRGEPVYLVYFATW
jgi:hypothetical protein